MGRNSAGGGGVDGKPNTVANACLLVRLRYIFLIATIFGGILLTTYTDILFVNNEAYFGLPGFYWESRSRESISYRYVIRTKGCSIPDLNQYDDDMKKFVEFPRNMKSCPNNDKPLLRSNRTYITVVDENKHHYNISENRNFSCCYKAFYRPDSAVDVASLKIDERVEYKDCHYFDRFIMVKDEFVRVSCYFRGIEIYQQFFVFTPHKKFISHGTNEIDNDLAYNVIIMGIDAVSRLNFRRTMPKTFKFLNNKGAVELFGYNKVGDNTFPNLIPLLMGMRDSDLKTTCLPNDQSTFDNCPFIWEWFKQAGYYTALGEDSSSLGSFNYLKVGFTKNPTDYYLHTFINEAEKYSGKIKDFNSYLCMDGQYFFQILLDYIENLTITLRTSKLFGFFWEVTMSHDYLNYPMVMDTSYEYLLNKLWKSTYLEETILILLSDHGIRWGDFRATKQGRLEDRLPFVYFLVPQSFRETYSEAYNNLLLNSRRLTTAFDIHETLNDLVDLNNIENKNIRYRSKNMYTLKKGMSLFLPIPNNRTCEMASIDDHWCTCIKTKKLSIYNKESIEAAEHLVRQLNNLLRGHKECSELMLAQLLGVMEMEVGTPDESEIGWREFMVTVRTTPGDGIFEATLRQNKLYWTLAGTVSRLNLYGNQSHCIHNYQLKLYCFCQ